MERSKDAQGVNIGPQTCRLPQELVAEVTAGAAGWRARGNVRRLWARDATLWTDSGQRALPAIVLYVFLSGAQSSRSWPSGSAK
jgi:hypothetical protein